MTSGDCNVHIGNAVKRVRMSRSVELAGRRFVQNTVRSEHMALIRNEQEEA